MDKLALITGASSGIGLEIATVLAQKGYHLILVSRRESALNMLAETLKESYGTQVTILAQDLTQPNAVETIIDALQEQSIQILVNNAGCGWFGAFADSDLKSQLNMIFLNIVALTTLTKALLPKLLCQKESYILNIASLSAYQPLPYMAVYSATKSYILSFSQALSEELSNTNIHVVVASPGFIRTPFLEYAHIDEKRFRLNILPAMAARTAAHLIIQAMLAKKRIVIIGIRYRFIVLFTKICTKLFGLRFLRAILIK